MSSKSLFSAALLGTAIMLTACATDPVSDTTAGTSTTPANDTVLNENVRQAVNRVPGVNPTDLTITTTNGVVTLTGRTTTRTQAQDAIEAARHVSGVVKVDYDINVDEP